VLVIRWSRFPGGVGHLPADLIGGHHHVADLMGSVT
jgi:hypothetical protein